MQSEVCDSSKSHVRAKDEHGEALHTLQPLGYDSSNASEVHEVQHFVNDSEEEEAMRELPLRITPGQARPVLEAVTAQASAAALAPPSAHAMVQISMRVLELWQGLSGLRAQIVSSA